MAPRSLPLICLVAASMGLHAAVLGMRWQEPRPPVVAASATPAGRPAAAWVSVGPLASVPVPEETEPRRLLETRAGKQLRDPLAELLPVQAEQALAAMPLEPPPALRINAEAGPGMDDIYLPRSHLSAPPAPRTPVALLWPEGDASIPVGHYVEVLALFIDEHGVVQRVRVEGKGLPPALEAVARDVFLGTSFLPGELKGAAVKSLMRIEVRFDADNRLQNRGALL